jgi:tetratricopeptide (TPR) repeat protein
MASDDQEKLKELERQKLLEEIRKRAEEAELKRIEDEEQRVSTPALPIPPPQPTLHVPPPTPVQPPPIPQESGRIVELRERVLISLERGKVDKAAEFLDELLPLLGDPTEIRSLRERVEKARQEAEEAKAKKRAAEQQAKEAAAQDRVRREAARKKATELLQKANDFYQAEKYDKAIELLDELLTLDPDNDEAVTLKASITKARDLASMIRMEEAKRRATEAANAPVVVSEPPPQTVGDPWGSGKAVTPATDEMGIPEVAEEKPQPPKPPLVERVVDRLSHVHIPIKPIAITLGILVVAATAYYVVTSLRQAVFPPKYSLLVAPAAGASGDSSSQFFAEAVTEDLLSTLSGVGELRLLAPQTTFSLRTYAGDLSQMARSLGANYYLQWSASRTEQSVTVQATLFDTVSRNPVWSRQYRNSLRELHGTVREIGRAILGIMQIVPKPQEEELFAKVSAISAGAYDEYARGAWYLRQGDPASLENAISAFAIALDQDSLFSDAHLGIALAHIALFERGDDTTLARIQAAWQHLNLAFALGARSSETYRIRGLVAQYQRQFDRALEEFERGVAFAPSDAETQRRLAAMYVLKWRFDDALKAARHALADDPRNVESYLLTAMILQLREENVEALRLLEQGARFAADKGAYMSGDYADVLEYTHQPEQAAALLSDRVALTQHYIDYYKLGRIYQTAGRPKPQWEATFRRAKEVIETIIAANPNDAHAYAYLALTETRLGAFKNALEANARARLLGPNNPEVLYCTARMYALQTDKSQALENLRRAIDVRYRMPNLLDMDFFNLRSEPEFQQAVTH